MSGAPVTRVPPGAMARPWPEGAGLTHRGCVRTRNEDAILTDPSGLLWAVSDGMGGHGHGDVASDIVIDCLAAITDERALAEGEGALLDQVSRANDLVRDRAQRLGGGTMGATVVAALVTPEAASLVWVGDSRAYLWRGGTLGRLTRDHTLVQDLVDEGRLTPEAAARHPEAHVLTRAVGAEAEVRADTARVALAPGDRLLLCSDGLTACLDALRLAQTLSEVPSPREACHQLLLDALDAGAPDNVSAVVVRIGGA